MLTRIEIDGFKSFRSLRLDPQPFTVTFGGNAVGRSNLFDVKRSGGGGAAGAAR